MDILEDYWKGHPYLEFITTLADVPGNFAANCSHWGDQFYLTTPFLVRDLGPTGCDVEAGTCNEEGWMHDLFGLWWSTEFTPPGLNLHYPLRTLAIPKVECIGDTENCASDTPTLELKTYIEQTGPGIMAANSAYEIWSWQLVYSSTSEIWYQIQDEPYYDIFNQMIEQCINDPWVKKWNELLDNGWTPCGQGSCVDNICEEDNKKWCGKICESEFINGCVDKFGPNPDHPEYVENYNEWATADYSGQPFLYYDETNTPICSCGEECEAECDLSDCRYKIPGCIEPHSSNCISAECCSIEDYEFYPNCSGLDSELYANTDDGSCDYSDGGAGSVVYNTCINPYSFNYNSSLPVNPTDLYNLEGISGCQDGTMNCCIFECNPPHPFEGKFGGDDLELQIMLEENPDLDLPEVWGSDKGTHKGHAGLPNRGGGVIDSRMGLSKNFKSNFGKRKTKITSKREYQKMINRKVEILLDNNVRSQISFPPNRECGDSQNPCFIPLVFHDVYSLNPNSFTGQTRSLCPGNPAECECIVYRAVQKLNQQFEDTGLQFYRACTNDELNVSTTLEQASDAPAGGWEGSTDRERRDDNLNILPPNQCTVYNTIPVLKENRMAEIVTGGGKLGYDHISLNGLAGDYPDMSNSFDQNHTYFTHLYKDRNINNVLNIYTTSCIGSEGLFCNDKQYGHTVYSWEDSIPDWDESSHYGIAIRQDALYSINNDGTPYDYATLPRHIGRFFGLFGTTETPEQSLLNTNIPAENTYGTVKDFGNMYCSQTYNSCTPDDGGCGDLCESSDCPGGEYCIRECHFVQDLMCDTATAPYQGSGFHDSELEVGGYKTNIDMNYCIYVGTGGSVDDDYINIIHGEGAGEGFGFDGTSEGRLYGTNLLDGYGDNESGYLDIPHKDYMQTIANRDGESLVDDFGNPLYAPLRNFMANESNDPYRSRCVNLGCEECLHFESADWYCTVDIGIQAYDCIPGDCPVCEDQGDGAEWTYDPTSLNLLAEKTTWYQTKRQKALSAPGFTKEQAQFMVKNLFDNNSGCNDPEGDNHNPHKIFDDGTCNQQWGCRDIGACNYDEDNTYDCDQIEDGDEDWCCFYTYDDCGQCGGLGDSCSGCTDPSALNFDSLAIIDDGSCTFQTITISNPTYDSQTRVLCIDWSNTLDYSPWVSSNGLNYGDPGYFNAELGFTLCSNGHECMDPQGPETCQYVGQLDIPVDVDENGNGTWCSTPFVNVPIPDESQNYAWTAHFTAFLDVFDDEANHIINESYNNVECPGDSVCHLCEITVDYPVDGTLRLANMNNTPFTLFNDKYEIGDNISYDGTIDIVTTTSTDTSGYEFELGLEYSDLIFYSSPHSNMVRESSRPLNWGDNNDNNFDKVPFIPILNKVGDPEFENPCYTMRDMSTKFEGITSKGWYGEQYKWLTTSGMEVGSIVDIYESTTNTNLENYFVAHMPEIGAYRQHSIDHRHLISPIFVPKERAEKVIEALERVKKGELHYSADCSLGCIPWEYLNVEWEGNNIPVDQGGLRKPEDDYWYYLKQACFTSDTEFHLGSEEYWERNEYHDTNKTATILSEVDGQGYQSCKFPEISETLENGDIIKYGGCNFEINCKGEGCHYSEEIKDYDYFSQSYLYNFTTRVKDNKIIGKSLYNVVAEASEAGLTKYANYITDSFSNIVIGKSSNKLLVRLPYTGTISENDSVCFKGIPTFYEDDYQCIGAYFEGQGLVADCAGYCADGSTTTGTCGYPGETYEDFNYPDPWSGCDNAADCPDGYECLWSMFWWLLWRLCILWS